MAGWLAALGWAGKGAAEVQRRCSGGASLSRMDG